MFNKHRLARAIGRRRHSPAGPTRAPTSDGTNTARGGRSAHGGQVGERKRQRRNGAERRRRARHHRPPPTQLPPSPAAAALDKHPLALWGCAVHGCLGAQTKTIRALLAHGSTTSIEMRDGHTRERRRAACTWHTAHANDSRAPTARAHAWYEHTTDAHRRHRKGQNRHGSRRATPTWSMSRHSRHSPACCHLPPHPFPHLPRGRFRFRRALLETCVSTRMCADDQVNSFLRLCMQAARWRGMTGEQLPVGQE